MSPVSSMRIQIQRLLCLKIDVAMFQLEIILPSIVNSLSKINYQFLRKLFLFNVSINNYQIKSLITLSIIYNFFDLIFFRSIIDKISNIYFKLIVVYSVFYENNK